jgi:adenylate cyclase
MAEDRAHRRLAAILAVDVVGYSRMMSEDESGTLAQIKTLRKELLDPKIAEYGGRLVKAMGDGLLVEFPSAVNAVQHALDVQTAMRQRNSATPKDRRIETRVGINVGDVIVEDNDLFGDGVNVASRLEGLAEPGGICISSSVHEQVRTKLKLTFENMGEQSLKNMPDPIQVYRVRLPETGNDRSVSAISDAVFRRPAVAVLPFANMSGDTEQDYFADGLTEDIITALSRCRAFPVIARNSTFAYKGKSPDIREVGKALGARYVVEGSVRKSGNRVRVTAQLINAETGHHIWAERYDRELDDIFALQDEITARIAATIEPAITGAEQKRLAARPPRELSAWDLCIQGQYLIYESTKDSNQRAREKFKQATEIDPDYSRAWSGLAYTYTHDLRLGYAKSRDEARQNALAAARRAVELDDTDSDAHAFLGRALNVSGQTENALEAMRHALDLNPQNASAMMSIGVIYAFKKDEPEEGIRWLERLLEVNPLDPRDFISRTHLAVANICTGKYERAAELARNAIRQRADYLESHAALASALGYLGHASDAAHAIGEFSDQVVDYAESHPLWNRTTKDTVLTGLRKAGLVQ